jgi:hypothetical protein
MTTEPIAIDPFLSAFVDSCARKKTAKELGRLAYLDALLRRCIEETGPDLLCPECRAMLDVERVFDPVGACARMMRLDCLALVLVRFVHRPWLRADPVLRLAQWRFVEGLLAELEKTPLPATREFADALASLHSHVDGALRFGRSER